jgi:hypothetical protein
VPAALIAVALLAFLASPALAATASVGKKYCDRYECIHQLVFDASPGEANAVAITGSETALIVTDRGASLSPKSGCTKLDEHSARCEYRDCRNCPLERLSDAQVALGDGNDRLSVSDATSITVSAGPGDDNVEIENGRVDGGGGRDTLTGGKATPISDGDDGSAQAPFDSDLISGPAIVDYGRRTSPVTVDLAAGVGGTAGEHDRLSGITGALGGSSTDHLTGTAGSDVLIGMGDDDEVVGGDGNDRLGGGTGADVLDGGTGDDTFSPGGTDTYPQSATRGNDASDRVVCGEGRDVVDEVFNDYVAPGCEHVWLLNVAIEPFRLSLPLASPTASLMGIHGYDCPQRRTRLTMTIRLADALRRWDMGTVLGRRATVCRKHYGFRNAALHLSLEGKRILRAAGRLRVVVTVEERNPDLFQPKRFWINRASFVSDLVQPA